MSSLFIPVYIPAWFTNFFSKLILLLSFPGVILHEISHRFFCDIYNIEVYSIDYFVPFSDRAGCVKRKQIDTLRQEFFIAIGPLIINSLVCIMLTFPMACSWYSGIPFLNFFSTLECAIHIFVAWVGYSAGLWAIPSTQDVSGLIDMAQSKFTKYILYIFVNIIKLCNMFDFFLRIVFTVFLSFLLPTLFLR